MKIKVVQKDLTGNVINKYESYATAAKTLGCNESTIRKAAKFNTKVFGKFTFENESEETGISIPDSPRILFLDIETAPSVAFVWKFWKENVGLDQVINNWFMLSWSAKWLGEDSMYYDVLTSEEAIQQNDARICATIWSLLDLADIVVAHNGNSFDLPKIQSRFVVHGFNPPSSYRQIDTKIISQQQFGFTSNKLEALARLFGIDGKFHTEFNLWKECYKGDEEALKKMSAYNCHDVEILEAVYLKLRPYIKNHPNLNMYNETGEMTCSICGSNHLTLVDNKYFYTQASKFILYRCGECGGLSRGKKSLIPKKIISAIPK